MRVRRAPFRQASIADIAFSFDTDATEQLCSKRCPPSQLFLPASCTY